MVPEHSRLKWRPGELELEGFLIRKQLFVHVHCFVHEATSNRCRTAPFVGQVTQPREAATWLQFCGAPQYGPATIIGQDRAEVQRTREV